jgi:hypothetical protein
MSIFKVRRKSDGLFKLSGSRGYNATGNAFSQIGFARSAITSSVPYWRQHNESAEELCRRRREWINDHEVVEYEVVEKAIHPAVKP